MFAKQVMFEVGGQLYGFDSMFVRTVEVNTVVRPVSGMPECVMGAATLRGELIPIYNLGKKFNVSGTVNNGQVIYVNTKRGCIGFMIESVQKIGTVEEELQAALPSIVRADSTACVAGIVKLGNDLVTVLNHDAILDESEYAMIDAAFRKMQDTDNKEE